MTPKSIAAPTNAPKVACSKIKGTAAVAPPDLDCAPVDDPPVEVELPVGLVVIVDLLVPLDEAPLVVAVLDETTVLPLIKLPEGVGADEP